MSNIVVYGHGNKQAQVCILAQNPGKTEANYKLKFNQDRPLIGVSGKELDTVYFPRAGVVRDELYMTNVCKEHFPEDRDPKPEEVEKWLPMLKDELAPFDIIITLGAFAKDAMGVQGDLYDIHGVPIYHNGKVIIPTYHPAAAMKGDSKTMQYIMDDFAMVGKLLRGEVEPFNIHEYEFQYGRLIDTFQLNGANEVGIDTESVNGVPYSIQVATDDNYGWWVDYTDQKLVRELGDYCKGKVVVLHHALHDAPILINAGWDLSTMDVQDSMLYAYHLGNIPKGLKALAYRLFGVKMTEYLELVKPYQNKVSIQWLKSINHKYPDLPKQQVWKKGKGLWEEQGWYQPQNLGKRIQKMINDYEGYAYDFVLNKYYTACKPLLRKYFGLKSIKDSKVKELIEQLPEDLYNEDLLTIFHETCTKYSGDKSIDLLDRWNKMENKEQVTEDMPLASLADVPENDRLRYGCLSKSSLVITDKGNIRIGDIVNQKLNVNVLTLYKGEITYKPIINWFKNTEQEHVKWMSLKHEFTKNGKIGIRYTPDHEIFVTNEIDGEIKKKEIQHLSVGETIITPFSCFSDDQISILIGNTLGDGWFHKHWVNGNLYSYTWIHCKKQLPYLQWLHKSFGKLSNEIRIYRKGGIKRIKGRTVNGSPMYSFSLKYSPTVTKGFELIQNREYIIRNNLLKTPLALACWYQDDGTLVQNKRARIYICSYTTEQADNLCNMLKNNYELLSNKFVTSDGYAIHISSSDKFFDLIAKYVHPCMRYKLPEEYRKVEFKQDINSTNKPVLAKVKSVFQNETKIRGELKTSYCIEVQDSHCFFTTNELVSNCLDAVMTLKIYKELRKKVWYEHQ